MEEGLVCFLRDRAGMVARSHSITIASELCCTMHLDSKEVKKVLIAKASVVLLEKRCSSCFVSFSMKKKVVWLSLGM